MGDNTAEEIRIGISGMGVRGTQYAELLLRKKGAVKLAAVTRGGVENTRLKEKISDAGCQIFHDEKELLEKGNVDAMIVAAPHYSHEKQVITALKKGIHVLCEKPAAVDIVQRRICRERRGSLPLSMQSLFNTGCIPFMKK